MWGVEILEFPKKILQLRSFLEVTTVFSSRLRAEVEVESGLESVEGELAGWEEPLGGGGGGGLEEEPGGGGGAVTGQVSGQKTGVLVGGVEGVDEGVEALAAGAVGGEGSVKDTGHLGGKLGAVLVEAEV